jgi:hypothetical protein
VDVPALERDSVLNFHVSQEGDTFVPVYWVYWRQPATALQGPISTHDDGFKTAAEVWLLLPEQRLLQLDVSSTRYLLRSALSVTNRDALLQQTNDELTRKMWFTTSAYKEAALEVAIAEASNISTKLHLPVQLPLTTAQLTFVRISTPFISDKLGNFGTIGTKDYLFSATFSNRMCWIQRNQSTFDELVYQAGLKARYTKPKTLINTNAAYRTATQWLGAISVDITALNRDCKASVDYWDLKNAFVPLYEVSWENPRDGGAAALVVIEPDNSLNSLVVHDVQYLKRPPLVVHNRDEILRRAQ